MNRIFLVGRQRRKRDGHRGAVPTVTNAPDGTGEAHGLIPCGEVDQKVNEVTGTQLTFARNHHATGGQVLERVLTDGIASLEQNRAAVDIDSVMITPILLCPGMSHQAFSLPSCAVER